MMGKLQITLAALALVATTTASQAADDPMLTTADHNGAAEIARGDYAAAERVLTDSRRVSPNDNDLLLNQAQLFQRSGRADAARSLYRQVLAQPDEAMLLTGDRWRSAHALARAGLRVGATTTVASVGR